MTGGNRHVLVLGRRDHAEAMRVAAGLTIFGHVVDLVFVDRAVEENDENIAQAELLELSDIAPLSLVDDPNVPRIDADAFGRMVAGADRVISL